MKSQTNLLIRSLLLWQPGPRLLILGRCRRGHQTIAKHEVELFEAEKSRLLNLPLSGTIVRALISKPLRFMAFPVTGGGSSRSIRIIVSEELGEVGGKGRRQTHIVQACFLLPNCVIWYCHIRIQNPSLTFRWHWLPWWIQDTTMSLSQLTIPQLAKDNVPPRKVFYICLLPFLISSNIWSNHAPISL